MSILCFKDNSVFRVITASFKNVFCSHLEVDSFLLNFKITTGVIYLKFRIFVLKLIEYSTKYIYILIFFYICKLKMLIFVCICFDKFTYHQKNLLCHSHKNTQRTTVNHIRIDLPAMSHFLF